jgi:hypothetical protein
VMTVYLLSANVLIINLLIAVFNSIYIQVQTRQKITKIFYIFLFLLVKITVFVFFLLLFCVSCACLFFLVVCHFDFLILTESFIPLFH